MSLHVIRAERRHQPASLPRKMSTGPMRCICGVPRGESQPKGRAEIELAGAIGGMEMHIMGFTSPNRHDPQGYKKANYR